MPRLRSPSTGATCALALALALAWCGGDEKRPRPDAGDGGQDDGAPDDAGQDDGAPPDPREQDLYDPAEHPELAYVPRFEEVTADSGIPPEAYGLRIAALDYDDDGSTDLMIVGRWLFRGNGDGTFVWAEEAFPDGPPFASGVGTGAVWADFDNDGDLDFYFFRGTDGISRQWEPLDPAGLLDAIWVNDGGVFREDQTALPDLVPLVGKANSPTTSAGWADYDRDGFVDLASASTWSTVTCCDFNGFTGGDVEIGNFTLLFHSLGTGRFEDATARIIPSGYDGPYPFALGGDTAGDAQWLNFAYGTGWGDFDDDGYQDLYVANYRLRPNELHRNSGEPSHDFEAVAEELGAAGDAEYTAEGAGPYYGHSTGASWGDYDDDGRLDLVVTNVSHPNTRDIRFQDFSDNTQLLHNGPDGFRDVREEVGIEWRERHFCPSWGDLNNDGLLDLFLSTDRKPDDLVIDHHSDVYLSRSGRFVQVNESSGFGLRHDRGAVIADVNDDGLLDIVAGGNSTAEFRIGIFLNRGNPDGDDNHFVRIRLRGNGRTSNTAAIGARIEIPIANDKVIVREVDAGSGSGSQTPFVQHVGLGSIEGWVDVRVRWPDGAMETYERLAVDELHEIVQP